MITNISNSSDTSPPCGTFPFGKTNSKPKVKEPHSITLFIKKHKYHEIENIKTSNHSNHLYWNDNDNKSANKYR